MTFSFRHVSVLAGVFLALAAMPAAAHPGHVLGGWTAGFSHPLNGWDHFVAMVTVGLWAAQHEGRARWAIPITFVAVMGLGGIAGAFGLPVPGVETVVLLSVIVLAGLVLARRRLPLAGGMAVTGLFAFFHGFAHGHEMPEPSMLVSFGAGFMVATALLHGLGYAAGRIAAETATRRNIEHI
jgi:urease accessory protein